MRVKAPWTIEQIRNLKAYQKSSYVHPFTCGNDSGHRNLIPTKDGWVCADCNYVQDWAHDFMADGSHIKQFVDEILKGEDDAKTDE